MTLRVSLAPDSNGVLIFGLQTHTSQLWLGRVKVNYILPFLSSLPVALRHDVRLR